MLTIYQCVNYALGAIVLFTVALRTVQFIVRFMSKEIRSVGNALTKRDT